MSTLYSLVISPQYFHGSAVLLHGSACSKPQCEQNDVVVCAHLLLLHLFLVGHLPHFHSLACLHFQVVVISAASLPNPAQQTRLVLHID